LRKIDFEAIQILDAPEWLLILKGLAEFSAPKIPKETLLHAPVNVFCLSRPAGLLLRQYSSRR
jgi:hypothetical protein